MISRPLDAHETIVTAVREAIEKTGSSDDWARRTCSLATSCDVMSCRSGSCPSTLSMFRSSTSRRRRGRVTRAEVVVRERQRMEARHGGDMLRDWIGGSRRANQGERHG